MSAMKFFLLRFNNFTKFSYTSSVIISLEFVSPDLRLTAGEHLLPLSVQKSPNLCVFRVLFLTGFHNGLPVSIGHGRRRLTNRQAFSLGMIDLFSVCIEEHLTDCGIIVTHVLEEPLLGEPLLGHGLCEGLDVSLREEVVLGLVTCVGEGLVS